MTNEIKAKILRHLSNLPGWRTHRKIIVFESDDWGSIRMPSRAVFEKLKKEGVDVSSGDALRYNLYDTLATENDLSVLYDILSSVKDKNDNPCVFTPVSLVTNPDFEKIRSSGFNEYFYEPFTKTLQKYGRENAFQLWQEGIEKHLFVPQFHGREHLNGQVWMDALQANDKHTRLAFDYGFWGYNNRNQHHISYQAAFDLNTLNELDYQHEVIADGVKLFEKIHGYKASFFVPPNGPFNNALEKTASENGIKFMSASKIQREALGIGKTRIVFHWLGQKNKHGQRYITRNCFFEPSQEEKDWVNSCLNDISIAFKWYKPAVISSHRVNYIGAIDPANRDSGLSQLKKLLYRIKKQWPDIEFMTSDQLGDLIVESN